MRTLVTGGCGFIGSHLVDRLVADGHSVTVLDNLSSGSRANLNPEAVLAEGDVADAARVRVLVGKADAVFHLAAVASVEACAADWLGSHRTNVTGTVTVLDAAARVGGIPVVYASSAAVYGDNPALPLAETAATQPINSYGRDKLSCEHYAAIAHQYHKVSSVGLRLFNIYGPRQNPASPYSGVISKFVAHARAGTALTLQGDGEQTRDFLYVGDVVTLLLNALAHATGATVFNGCTGKAVSLNQLVKILGEAAGKPLSVIRADPRMGDIRHSCGDASQAEKVLGFSAKTILLHGLSQLLTSDA